MIINIPPSPFEGGDVMVSIHEKLFWTVYFQSKKLTK